MVPYSWTAHVTTASILVGWHQPLEIYATLPCFTWFWSCCNYTRVDVCVHLCSIDYTINCLYVLHLIICRCCRLLEDTKLIVSRLRNTAVMSKPTEYVVLQSLRIVFCHSKYKPYTCSNPARSETMVIYLQCLQDWFWHMHRPQTYLAYAV